MYEKEPCSPANVTRPLEAPRRTGPVVDSPNIRYALVGSSLSRTVLLLDVLTGGSANYDDCLFDIASALRQEPLSGTFFDQLDTVVITITQAPWHQVRPLALAAYEKFRANYKPKDAAFYDWRTDEDFTDDVQFNSSTTGDCEACARDLPGDRSLHRFLAVRVATTYLTWDSLEEYLENDKVPRTPPF